MESFLSFIYFFFFKKKRRQSANGLTLHVWCSVPELGSVSFYDFKVMNGGTLERLIKGSLYADKCQSFNRRTSRGDSTSNLLSIHIAQHEPRRWRQICYLFRQFLYIACSVSWLLSVPSFGLLITSVSFSYLSRW